MIPNMMEEWKDSLDHKKETSPLDKVNKVKSRNRRRPSLGIGDDEVLSLQDCGAGIGAGKASRDQRGRVSRNKRPAAGGRDLAMSVRDAARRGHEKKRGVGEKKNERMNKA